MEAPWIPLAQTLADETAAGHTRLVQAPRGAAPARLLAAVAHELHSGFRVAQVSAAAGQTPAALASAALEAATGARVAEPEFGFEAYLAHLTATQRGLVLLIDDIAALPPATVAWLRGCMERAGDALRLVATAPSGGAALFAAQQLGVALTLPARAPASRGSARRAAPSGRWHAAVLAVAMLGVGALALLVWALPA